MKKIVLIALATLIGTLASARTEAATIQFDLFGFAGPGLLPGNERPSAATSTGFGGEIGVSGITFDDVSKALTLNVAWGSGNGFGDLTNSATVAHLHRSDTNGGGVLGFGGVLRPLSFNNASADNGFISQTLLAFTPTEEALLLNGNIYVNIHTSANPGGEIRGNLIVSAIPEPASFLALGVVGAGAAAYRRRKKNVVAS